MNDIEQLILRVPRELKKAIKQEALDQEKSINELLIAIIEVNIKRREYVLPDSLPKGSVILVNDPTQPIFTTNCQTPQAKCLIPTNTKYKISFQTDEGLESKEYYLCEEHVKKAWKEGVKVEKT